MMFLSVGIFWLAAGILSLLTCEDRAYSQTWLFKASGTLVFLALLCWSASAVVIPTSSGHEALIRVSAFVLVTIIGTALALRFWTCMMGDLFDQSRATLMGNHRLKVERTFDHAQKAEKEGDLEGAGRLYAEEIAKDPTDAEPFRRLAAIRLRQGRYEEAQALLREAIPLVKDPEDKSTLAFRLSDLLVQSGRSPEARSLLESMEREFAGSRFANYARERLDRMNSPPSNPITPG